MREYTDVQEDPLKLEVFTDTINYSLWIECSDTSDLFLDQKMDKYIKIEGLSDSVTVCQLLDKIRSKITEKLGKEYEDKLTYRLPNNKYFNDDKNDDRMMFLNQINTLKDVGINSFTPILFYNPGKNYEKDKFWKKGEKDKLIINFPFYMKQKDNRVSIPLNNNQFEV